MISVVSTGGIWNELQYIKLKGEKGVNSGWLEAWDALPIRSPEARASTGSGFEEGESGLLRGKLGQFRLQPVKSRFQFRQGR